MKLDTVTVREALRHACSRFRHLRDSVPIVATLYPKMCLSLRGASSFLIGGRLQSVTGYFGGRILNNGVSS